MKKNIKIKGGLGNFHSIGYGIIDENGKIIESVSTVAVPRKIRFKGKSMIVLVPKKFLKIS